MVSQPSQIPNFQATPLLVFRPFIFYNPSKRAQVGA
jgi:hypothetical protein